MPQRRSIAWLPWLLLVPFALLVGLTVSFMGTDYLTNNNHLRQLKAELAALPLPPQTQSLSSRSAVGKLGGNSNHLDFFVGSLFRSTLTPTAVQEYYAGRTFHNPVTTTREKFRVFILATPEDFNSPFLLIPESMAHPSAWGVSTNDFTSSTIYLVSFFEQYPPNSDYRCN